MINLLVLGVGGNVSLGILKALKLSKIKCNIIGACVSSNSIGLYLCDKAYISPFAHSEDFIPWIIDICNKEKINMVLTGVEEIIDSISKNYDYIKRKTNTLFKFNNYNKFLIGQDKLKTCEWLKENGCNFPRYCKSGNLNSLNDLLGGGEISVIAKPRIGKGSYGVFKINSEEEAKKFYTLDNYIFQECIGNEDAEYTIGCYCDKHGKLVDVIIMHRELKDGYTQKATVVENPAIREEAVKICNAFNPVGPLNIQLRLDDKGIPVCFELNVRFSGTTPMRANFGYNDVAAMIKEYLFNEDISNEFKIRKGTSYRYINELYLFDDVENDMECSRKIDSLNKYNIYTDTFGGLK